MFRIILLAMLSTSLAQGRHGTCRPVEEGAKFNDCLIKFKFKTFALTNSKSPENFQQSIKISENWTIVRKLGVEGTMAHNFLTIVRYDVPAFAVKATDLESTYQSA